jgi:hypothetical protein
MRNSLFLLFALISFGGLCSDIEYQVFESKGYYGIMNNLGQIQVPAVYEQLGWSTGERIINNEVIGYRENGRWGLLNVKNRRLTKSQFHSIALADQNKILASIKGTFSNQLFYGLLDLKGNTIISFNYSTIEISEKCAFVSKYESGTVKIGAVTFDNEILIPIDYLSIDYSEHFFFARDFNAHISIYSTNGELRSTGVDSLIETNNQIKLYADGRVGLMDYSGDLTYPVLYKSIHFTNRKWSAQPFPKWDIYAKDTLVHSAECDSLDYLGNDVWITYTNGASQLIIPKVDIIKQKEVELLSAVAGKMVVRNAKSKKWSVLSKNGDKIIPDVDSIAFFQGSFYARSTEGWDIFTKFGRKVNSRPFERVKPGIANQHIIRKNDYWGLLAFDGEKVLNFKFDSIRVCDDQYCAKFVDKWGVMDRYGNWIVYPEYESIDYVDGISYGRKGAAYSFWIERKFMFRTTLQPVEWIKNYLVLQDPENGFIGLLNNKGELFQPPIFNNIFLDEDFLVLEKEKLVSLVHVSGKTVIKLSDGVEAIQKVSEDYVPIRKNSRWGFVDMDGKLRISNRYDDIKPFSEQLAAYSLRGNWGFLDTNEKLVIQPFYDEVFPFKNGLAIVNINGLFGVIDYSGKEIVKAAYKSIRRTQSNLFVVEDQSGLYGLADENGRFIIRPSLMEINPLRKTIVRYGDQYGLLNDDGSQLYPANYDAIKIYDDFIGLKTDQSKRLN